LRRPLSPEGYLSADRDGTYLGVGGLSCRPKYLEYFGRDMEDKLRVVARVRGVREERIRKV